jgi:nucleoside-diphosphate-sugar epimerase
MSCVLITGATGVIGSELVPLFLDDAFQVRLIVRARSPDHVRQRMDELFRYWQRRPDDPRWAGRLEALIGDVSRPKLGLDIPTFDRLARQLTHIVHAAGNVKLNQTIEEARRGAVDPARHVAELARACQRSGQFVKLDAVSTVGVAGRMPGLVPERPLTEPRQFHNNYERAKAEAENYLLGELAAGLPVTIHRPSMVVGRSDNGRVIRKQIFYYLCEFLTGKPTWGFLPNFGDAKLDIIPVDYVARAIHLCARRPDSVGRIVHLCSGPEKSIRLVDLSERLRRLARQNGQKLPRLRFLPVAWFRRALGLLTALTWGRPRRRLAALPYFLSYLEEPQDFAASATEPSPPPHAHLDVLLPPP